MRAEIMRKDSTSHEYHKRWADRPVERTMPLPPAGERGGLPAQLWRAAEGRFGCSVALAASVWLGRALWASASPLRSRIVFNDFGGLSRRERCLDKPQNR